MKVYLVSTGEYSDFQNRGVYSTKEKAKDACLFMEYDTEITEWEIDPPIPEHPPGTFPWLIWMMITGETRHTKGAARCFPEDVMWGDSLSPWDHPEAKTDPYYTATIHCWAKDEKHAVKIANERRIKWIAENK